MDKAAQQHIWDPIREDINVAIFQFVLLEKLKYYQKYPYRPFLNTVFLTILSGLLVFLTYTLKLDIEFYILSFVPVFSYVTYIFRLQNKLILLMLTQKNNWAFDPSEDSSRADKFAKLFPDIFDRGHTRFFSQQIWGTIPFRQETLPFWTSKFTYITGQGKRRSSHNSYIFCFPLPKILPVSIILEEKHFLNTTKGILETESVDFNNTFKVVSPDDNPVAKQKIMQVLTPSVQTRLIEFAEAFKPNVIIFHHDIMLIERNASIWTTHHTNLFLSPTIHPTDVENSKTSLLAMAELNQEMLEFMD